jgi:hypothetical protein
MACPPLQRDSQTIRVGAAVVAADQELEAKEKPRRAVLTGAKGSFGRREEKTVRITQDNPTPRMGERNLGSNTYVANTYVANARVANACVE